MLYLRGKSRKEAPIKRVTLQDLLESIWIQYMESKPEKLSIWCNINIIINKMNYNDCENVMYLRWSSRKQAPIERTEMCDLLESKALGYLTWSCLPLAEHHIPLAFQTHSQTHQEYLLMGQDDSIPPLSSLRHSKQAPSHVWDCCRSWHIQHIGIAPKRRSHAGVVKFKQPDD